MSHAQHLTVTDEWIFSQALIWHCFSNCLPPAPSPSLSHTIVPEASVPLPGLEFVTCAIKSQGYCGSSNASDTTQEGRPMGFAAFRPVQSRGENHCWQKKTSREEWPFSLLLKRSEKKDRKTTDFLLYNSKFGTDTFWGHPKLWCHSEHGTSFGHRLIVLMHMDAPYPSSYIKHLVCIRCYVLWLIIFPHLIPQ